MAKDRGLDDQIDSDEELLNFDLDDLSLSEDSEGDLGAEEEIIELVELVERGPSEDITRDLKIREWSAAGGKKPGQTERPSAEAKPTAAAEEEPELDLSDISLEMDAEPGGDKAAAMFSGDEITEADLEGLLQEEEGITLDLADEGLDLEEKGGEEISEADLQALLAESGEQSVEEQAEEEAPLDLLGDEEVEEMDLERMEETQVLDLKPPMEESIVVEEPADILAKEVEELGAAAALEEEEAAAVEIVMPEEEEEEEEEAEVAAVSEDAERVVEEEETVEEETYAEEALTGISEEKLEGIIRKVVGEVVERAARETMTEVAERMIGEAIDALRRDLEASGS